MGSGFAFTPPILAGLSGCVCFCAHSACTPPILAGVCGACVRVWVLASTPQFWLGFVVGVSGFGFCFNSVDPGWLVGRSLFVCALCLYPASPGLGLRSVCSRAAFAFTPPILAGVCGVCVLVQVLLSPHLSWVGCLGVRV